LRVGAALSLIGFHAGALTSLDPSLRLALFLASALGGILLLIGLWTPVAGVAVAVAEVWGGLALGFSHPDDRWIYLLLAILAAGVAMVGPGAWSVDSRLFGRKRFEIDGRKKHR
jgi:putative oxidoreductase